MALRKQDLIDLLESYDLQPQVKSSILKKTGRGGSSASRDYIQALALLAEFNKVQSGESLGSKEWQLGQLSSLQGISPFRLTSHEQLWSVLHPATKLRLINYTPCLCSRYDELKEPQQKALFNDSNWVFTEKLNGIRAWLICLPPLAPGLKSSIHLFSRNYSSQDCSLLEYSSNVFSQDFLSNFNIKSPLALDCELLFNPRFQGSSEELSKITQQLGISTLSPLEAVSALLQTYPESAQSIQSNYYNLYNSPLLSLHIIHPLYVGSNHFINQPLSKGKSILPILLDKLQPLFSHSGSPLIKPIPQCSGNSTEKSHFLDTILSSGGEGVVCHNLKGSYLTTETRSKTTFIKIKRSLSQTSGLGDSFDAFITGIKPGSPNTANEGLISALEFSIYIHTPQGPKIHHIASCPNISRDFQIKITLPDASGLYPTQLPNGSFISLNPLYANLVAEVDGQALSSVSKRLEHPRILRFRPERSPESCIYTQEFIDSQTTGKGISY